MSYRQKNEIWGAPTFSVSWLEPGGNCQTVSPYTTAVGGVYSSHNGTSENKRALPTVLWRQHMFVGTDVCQQPPLQWQETIERSVPGGRRRNSPSGTADMTTHSTALLRFLCKHVKIWFIYFFSLGGGKCKGGGRCLWRRCKHDISPSKKMKNKMQSSKLEKKVSFLGLTKLYPLTSVCLQLWVSSSWGWIVKPDVCNR